jgi:hypothetical protein
LKLIFEMYEIRCAKLEMSAESDWIRLVDDIDTGDRRGRWVLRKVAPAGIVADEGCRELIHSAGEELLEELICSECWRSGPARSCGIDDGVDVDLLPKPAGNGQAFEVWKRVAELARLDTLRYIQVATNIDKLQYLLIQSPISIHMVFESSDAVHMPIGCRVDKMHRFDHLEKLLLVEYPMFAGVKIFVVFGKGERVSTAFVSTTILLDNDLTDIGLRRLDVRAACMMGLDFVVDSEEETGEIVDDYFLIKQWRSDKVGHLGHVSVIMPKYGGKILP